MSKFKGIISKNNEKISLVEEAQQLKKEKSGSLKNYFQCSKAKQREEEQKKQLEEQIIYNTLSFGSALMSVKANASQDLIIPLQTGPPKEYRFLKEIERQKLLQKNHILIEGEDLQPPIKTFKDMRLPSQLMKVLASQGIKKPTAIQMQGIPCALSGRDLIAIAYTGTGKSLIFILELILYSMQQELQMPIIRGEGPLGLILTPSHELAIQHYESIKNFCQQLYEMNMPKLRCMLNIGGMELRAQLKDAEQGVHIVIATPGRLSDIINRQKINLDLCRILILDEADRLLDLTFEEELKNIINHYPQNMQRQTMLFSSTMPNKVQQFAKTVLYKPIIINIGRAGQANLDVIQDVEYVKEENKLIYLIECLKKTAPPVLIFAELKNYVDDVHEYLLLKGVEVCGLHGGKTQEERCQILKEFNAGKKDVLVATDVAAAGLDFKGIKHVINYDMPKDIEAYVHRIGRTGRCGKTGRATTFVNKNQDQNILLDLKHLLIEAKQEIPLFMKNIQNQEEIQGACNFCGGLGHTTTNCNKLEKQRIKSLAANVINTKDVLVQGNRFLKGGYGGEM